MVCYEHCGVSFSPNFSISSDGNFDFFFIKAHETLGRQAILGGSPFKVLLSSPAHTFITGKRFVILEI